MQVGGDLYLSPLQYACFSALQLPISLSSTVWLVQNYLTVQQQPEHEENQVFPHFHSQLLRLKHDMCLLHYSFRAKSKKDK